MGGGIEASGLRRSFGSVHAVRDVSFTAPAGAVTALVGPNGSGKTTLMLMLATLLAPDAGTMRLDGRDPRDDAAAVRGSLGWMPDALGSWSSLSCRAALQFTARLYGRSRADAAARADELIGLVGLEPLADRPTRVLSRGQKQRLSLARALVADPSVLILDEPASGLDPAARADLKRLIRGLAAEGRTVLVTSHVLSELEEIADTAVHMRDGRTVDAADVLAARTGSRQWFVRSTDQDLLAAVLARRTGATPAPDPRGLLVQAEDDAAAARLLADLVGEGVPVVAFAPTTGDLERVAVRLGEDLGAGR